MFKKLPQYFVLYILVILLGSSSQIWAQHQIEEPQTHDHDAYHKIERAYRDGKLNIDQKVLYKIYVTQDTQKLPPEYQPEKSSAFKCGTPAISDYHRNKSRLFASSIREMESIIGSSQIQSETYRSPSGLFTIHYETTGSHAVPSEDSDNDGTPDYVEQVAAAADSSYQHQVQNLGYSDPIPAGETYQVEIRNLKNFYGQTYPTGSGTAIQIENDYVENFPTNNDPDGDQIGAIKATMAHEFKHAIQYEANSWDGETGNWLEMDATLMEEVTYDDVNDYYNYIREDESIFNSPTNSFYPGSYYHVTWALYFQEKYGPEFWVEVWKIIKENPQITMVDALTQQLGGNEAFKQAYTESQLWHYASGPDNSLPDFGFEERENYPSPNITYQSVGDNALAKPDTLNYLSASYFDIQPSPFSGTIALNLSKYSNLQIGFAVLGYFKDGGGESIYINNQQAYTHYETNWQWDEIEKMGIVAVNGFHQQGPKYELAIQSVNPQTVRVEPNYPNPFNNQTTIRFSLTDRQDVQLIIYDVLGRKVATLVDESRSEGIYQEQFNANGHASGIYIYRLIIDGESTTKKMTLIK